MKDSQLILYHGSLELVPFPLPERGNPHNDYGPGFYCTTHLELAEEWSCRGQEFGVVNEYRLDVSELKTLNLSGREYNILNWLAVLLENRVFDISLPIPAANREYILENFLPDYKSYDLIKGHRADDSYFSYARDFLNNSISLSQLQRAMRLGRLGEQVVLRSEKAFGAIEFVKPHAVDGRIYFAKRMSRDSDARKDYRAIRTEVLSGEEILAIDIRRQNWKNDDPRLR